MAGGNIFLAIQNGVKVYLNKRNVFLTWLKNEVILVYTIEDFDQDLKDNNIDSVYSKDIFLSIIIITN